MAVSREHRARYVPGETHDCLLRNLRPFRKTSDKCVAEIVPAVAYPGGRAGVLPRLPPLADRLVQPDPMEMRLPLVTYQPDRVARKYKRIHAGFGES